MTDVMEIYFVAIRAFLHADAQQVTAATQAKWPAVSAKTRCLLESTVETDSLTFTVEHSGRSAVFTLEATRLIDGFLAAYSAEQDYLLVARIVPD